MNDTFGFAMGEFEARFPRNYRYAKNHMWATPADQHQTWRFGLTAYAVRLLQDVYFLDWLIEPDAILTLGRSIGSIESKKAESDLYPPIAGTLSAINEDCLADPSLINADPYVDGWLIEVTGAGTELLDADGYAAHLASAWQVAQRTIKGQVNA